MININIKNIYIKMQNKEGLILIKNKEKEYYIDFQGRTQGECKIFTHLGKIYEIYDYVDDCIVKYIKYLYNTDIILIINIYSENRYHK